MRILHARETVPVQKALHHKATPTHLKHLPIKRRVDDGA